MPLEPLPPHHARHTWETLAGNALVREALRRAIDEGRLPHGVLLHGPEQTGKMALAAAAAKHLLAGAWPPSSEAARRAAAKVERSTHPDLIFLRPDTRAGKALQIKIEDVREIERLAPLSPIEAAWRVVIIDGASQMNPNTANSILKLLEEPPPHCKFFLIAARRAALLPTVVSRCMPVRLGAVPAAELAAWLTDAHGWEPAQAQLAARWSEGRPGAALSLPLAEWDRHLTAAGEAMAAFWASGFSGVFRAAAQLMTLGDEARLEGEPPLAAALRWLRLWLRDQLVATAAPGRAELLTRPAGATPAGWPLEALTTLGAEIERLAPLEGRAIDGVLALETVLTAAGRARTTGRAA